MSHADDVSRNGTHRSSAPHPRRRGTSQPCRTRTGADRASRTGPRPEIADGATGIHSLF